MKNYFKNRTPEAIDRQLDSLNGLMRFLKIECDVWSYLIYGTLLGAVREKNVIAGDTDYDIAILLKGNNVKERLDCFYQIANVLIKNNMLRKIWRKQKPNTCLNPTMADVKNPLGQMHVQTPDGKYCIDVWLSWFDNGKYYLNKGVNGALNRNDIVPFKIGQIRGNNFVIPNQSEKVLEHIYGGDWTIPKNIKSIRQSFTMRDIYDEKTS